MRFELKKPFNCFLYVKKLLEEGPLSCGKWVMILPYLSCLKNIPLAQGRLSFFSAKLVISKPATWIFDSKHKVWTPFKSIMFIKVQMIRVFKCFHT